MGDIQMINSFEQSLFIDSIKDISIDFAEKSIDSLTDNTLINEIPVVKSIVAIYHGVRALNEQRLIKNTIAFIQEINKQDCNVKKIEKYKKKIFKSEKRYKDELERILMILDKEIETKKTIYLARLFSALINQHICLQIFTEYSEILDRLLIGDIQILLQEWSNRNQCLLLVKRDYSKNLDRVALQGIGEKVFIDNDPRSNKEKAKTVYYGFDEYSQLFIEIISNPHLEKSITLCNDNKSYLSSSKIEYEIINNIKS